MHNKYFKDGIYVLVSNALRLISKFIVSILAAKLLGPTNFGFYNLIDLVGKYGPISTLGVPSGTSREIPINLGKGKINHASKLNDTGFTGMFITTGMTALVILGISIFSFSGITLFAISMASLGVIANAIYEYHIVYLYSYSQFRIASLVISVYATFLLILSLSLILIFDIWGQLFAIFLVPVSAIIYVYSKRFHHFSISIDYPLYFHIIKIGLPMLLIGLGETFLITLDRILIVKYFDITNLGYYGLAIMVFVFSQQVHSAISQVIYPKLNLLFGQSKNVDKFSEITIPPAILLSIGMPPLIAVLMYILPLVVKYYLPEYSNGILSAEIIMIPISVYTINILNTLFKIKIIFSVLALSIIFKIVSVILLYNLSVGLEGVAIASSMSLLFYSLIITVLSLFFMGKNIRYIFRYIVLFIFIPVLNLTIYFLYINGLIFNIVVIFIPITFYMFMVYKLFHNQYNWSAFLFDLENGT